MKGHQLPSAALGASLPLQPIFSWPLTVDFCWGVPGLSEAKGSNSFKKAVLEGVKLVHGLAWVLVCFL
jgi:hypothetical protein